VRLLVDKINSTPLQKPSVNAVILPCKVGDSLYRQDGIWQCVGFDCDQTGNWRVKLRKDESNHYLQTRMVFGSFGKTVFTSKEEYEKVFPPKNYSITKEQQERLDFLKSNNEQHENWLKMDYTNNKQIDDKYIL